MYRCAAASPKHAASLTVLPLQIVPEQSLCAPELLLDLVSNGSEPPPDDEGGVPPPRDPDFVVPTGGLRVKNSRGEVAWTITPNGECTLLGTHAEGSLVIWHAQAATEIVLTEQGVVFSPAASTSLLLPSASLQEKRNVPSRVGPADPCRLEAADSSK